MEFKQKSKKTIKNIDIEALFIALTNIFELKESFKKLSVFKDNTLSKLLSEYMIKNVNKDFIIEQAENIIKTSNIKKDKTNSNPLYLNSFNSLIQIILNLLHNDLNTKPKKEDNKIRIKDYDKDFTYNKFIEAFNNENDSIIMNLFFGIFEITYKYSCCQIEKYEYKIFKYLNHFILFFYA